MRLDALTKKKRKIGGTLVFVSLLQILLGLFIVYGAATAFSFNLVFFVLTFKVNQIEQTLIVVLGSLLLAFGFMFLGLSKRFF